MRKVILYFAAVLTGVFVIFFLVDRRSDHIVEQTMWKLNRRQMELARDPSAIPDLTFDRLIGDYNTAIRTYGSSRLAPYLYLRLGEIYALRKDYETARKTFYDLIKAYPQSLGVSADAFFQIGKTHEAAGSWDQALAVYQMIIRDYPGTDAALILPIYIAEHYKWENNLDGSASAYEEAIRHYSDMADSHKGKVSGLEALRYLSNCYFEVNRLTDALKTLAKIIEEYAASGYLTIRDIDLIVKTVNIVSVYQLKDFDLAIGLYQGIVDRNASHPLKPYLEKTIAAFKELREKGFGEEGQP